MIEFEDLPKEVQQDVTDMLDTFFEQEITQDNAHKYCEVYAYQEYRENHSDELIDSWFEYKGMCSKCRDIIKPRLPTDELLDIEHEAMQKLPELNDEIAFMECAAGKEYVVIILI